STSGSGSARRHIPHTCGAISRPPPSYGGSMRNFRGLTLPLVGSAALFAGCSTSLPAPPAPSRYGTRDEIGTRGDAGNGDELFGQGSAVDSQTQERMVGAPARFSGGTTWVDSVTFVPAATFVDGYHGNYAKVSVRIFNRDTESQSTGASDFRVTAHGTEYGRS